MVKYCSKDCERAAWPRHRRTCSTLANVKEQLSKPENSAAKEKQERITRWVSFWTRYLVEYGIYGINLADNPERLTTHMYVVLASTYWVHFDLIDKFQVVPRDRNSGAETG